MFLRLLEIISILENPNPFETVNYSNSIQQYRYLHEGHEIFVTSIYYIYLSLSRRRYGFIHMNYDTQQKYRNLQK